MKKLLAAAMLGMFVLSACTGTFTLTKKVHKFNREFKNKWVEEAVFLAFVIVPVYSISTLGDALIFNTFEFWTGKNPVASTDKPAPAVAYDPLLNHVVVSDQENGKVMLTLEEEDGVLLARTADGTLICRVIKNTDGSVSVFSPDGSLLQELAPEQLASLQARFAG